MGVQQYFLNKHFEKVDVQAMLKENLEKTNAKRAKKGLPPINEKAAEDNLKRMQERIERDEAQRTAKEEMSRQRLEKADGYYQLESIQDRAKMVQQFEQKKKK